MVLLTWHLIPAEVDPRGNPETWESQFYFTSCTLSRSRILLLSNGAMFGLIVAKSRS